MYHRINKIECPSLDKLNNLARLTIDFGLERECRDPEDVVKPSFIHHFTSQNYLNAGEWLWGKPVAILQPLLQLLALPLAEKDGILAAYDIDTDPDRCFENNYFAIKLLPPGCQPVLDLVNTILGNFYTHILFDGVPADKIGEKEPLTRQSILRSFRDTQQKINMMVCPGCDGAPPEEETDGAIREDIDHFFPKSLYPFLSIHPLNLTPFCKHCNQDYKKDKDPLRPDNGELVSFAEIYHPYFCQARDDGVEAVIERLPEDGKLHLHLRANFADPRHVTRIKSLNHLLSLETRWDGALQAGHVTKELKYALTYATREERSSGLIPNDAWLQRKLENIVETMKDGVGEQERYVSVVAYTQWVRSDPETRLDWLRIIRTSMQ